MALLKREFGGIQPVGGLVYSEFVYHSFTSGFRLLR